MCTKTEVAEKGEIIKMTIQIKHTNKIVEFYNVPENIAKSIKTLLHAIELEESDIISAEYEVEH